MLGLAWHLQHNHFPPVDLAFLPTAEHAIDLVNDELWHDEITMPNGVTLTAGQIVEQLHLHDYLGAFA